MYGSQVSFVTWDLLPSSSHGRMVTQAVARDELTSPQWRGSAGSHQDVRAGSSAGLSCFMAALVPAGQPAGA